VRTKITFRIALGLLLAIASFAHSALAQNYRGAVRGRVTDPQGASIVGAQVKLIDAETNESRTLKTDGNGDFTISLIRPGSYRLLVEKEGFHKSSEKLVVRVNQEARLDVTLEAAAADILVIIVDDAATSWTGRVTRTSTSRLSRTRQSANPRRSSSARSSSICSTIRISVCRITSSARLHSAGLFRLTARGGFSSD
jgi:hypothetical protein